MYMGLASNDDALVIFGWIFMGIFYLLNYFNEKQERKNATERKRQEQAHQAQSRQRQERLESERLERERLERESLERERLERERRERERRDREQRIENWIKAAQKSAQELALKARFSDYVYYPYRLEFNVDDIHKEFENLLIKADAQAMRDYLDILGIAPEFSKTIAVAEYFAKHGRRNINEWVLSDEGETKNRILNSFLLYILRLAIHYHRSTRVDFRLLYMTGVDEVRFMLEKPAIYRNFTQCAMIAIKEAIKLRSQGPEESGTFEVYLSEFIEGIPPTVSMKCITKWINSGGDQVTSRNEDHLYDLSDEGVIIDDAESDIQNAFNRSLIMSSLDVLTEVQKNILISRFGLNGNIPESLESIADRSGVTRERIRQIESKAKEKIRIEIIKKESVRENYVIVQNKSANNIYSKLGFSSKDEAKAFMRKYYGVSLPEKNKSKSTEPNKK